MRRTHACVRALVRAAVPALLALAPTAPPARAQTALPPGFSDRLVVGGLDLPTGMAMLPDGRVLVVEQFSAAVRLVLPNGVLASVDPVCTIDAINTSGLERGLLGIAVDPGWPSRPYVYVHGTTIGGHVRVSRYRVAGDLSGNGNQALTIDVGTRYDLVNDVPDNAFNHNGGTLLFGPDGRLYASFGEDADACGAQDSTALKGTILRLDVSRLPDGPGSATRDLVTPADNPYAGSSNLNRRLQWEKGLRNPFRFDIDPAGGTLYIGDVGEATWEEVDVAPAAGMNFGWPLFEGFQSHATCAVSLPAPVDPIYVFDHTEGAAVIGGVLYRAPAGARVPLPAAYEGRFFFSDYYGGFLRVLQDTGAGWDLVGGVDATNWGTGFDAVSDYLIGRDGAIWYCRQAIGGASNSGQVRRIVYGSDTTVSVPRIDVAFGPAFPSPAPGYTTLRYTISSDAMVRMRLYDERGRLVRTLVPLSRQSAPGGDVTWDGRDEHGEDAPPGLYFARLEVAGSLWTQRVVLLR